IKPGTVQITTVGVFVSGLAGAIVAAYFNGKNMREAHQAERKMWALEKSHEMQMSVRKQRTEDYRELLICMDEFVLLLTRAYNKKAPPQLDQHAAREMEKKLKELVTTVSLFSDNSELEETLNAVTEKLSPKFEAMAAENDRGYITSDGHPTLGAEMATNRQKILSFIKEDLNRLPDGRGVLE
ncbi:hypothetical protein, partial [Arthrobacter oryzae]